MKSRATIVVISIVASITGLAFGASKALGANSPPLSHAWNIATSGKAGSSGDLVFRITPRDTDSDPIEISVPVIGGTSEDGVTRNIRRALSSQLRAELFDVTLGQNSNVIVSDARGQPNFSLELLDSDVENVRVVVQSVAPAAPPTVPEQRAPANPPQGGVGTPPAPGNAAPPVNAPPQTQGDLPSSAPPPASSAPPPASSAPPSNAPGGAGAPASAPPGN